MNIRSWNAYKQHVWLFVPKHIYCKSRSNRLAGQGLSETQPVRCTFTCLFSLFCNISPLYQWAWVSGAGLARLVPGGFWHAVWLRSPGEGVGLGFSPWFTPRLHLPWPPWATFPNLHIKGELGSLWFLCLGSIWVGKPFWLPAALCDTTQKQSSLTLAYAWFGYLW